MEEKVTSPSRIAALKEEGAKVSFAMGKGYLMTLLL